MYVRGWVACFVLATSRAVRPQGDEQVLTDVTASVSATGQNQIISSPIALLDKQADSRRANPWDDIAAFTASANNLLDQAKQASNLQQKWDNVVNSIGDSDKAAKAANWLVNELAKKLDHIGTMIHENEMEGLLDGDVTVSDLTLLKNPQACVDVTDSVLSLARDLDHLSSLTNGVAEVLRNVKDLTDGVAELAGAWADFDTSVFASLSDRIADLVSQLKTYVGKLQATDEVLRPVMNYKDMSQWEMSKHLARNHEAITKALRDLGWMWASVRSAFFDVIRPLDNELLQTIHSLMCTAHDFKFPGSRPTEKLQGCAESMGDLRGPTNDLQPSTDESKKSDETWWDSFCNFLRKVGLPI